MLHLPALAIATLLDQLLPAPCLMCGLASADYRLLCRECDNALPRLTREPFYVAAAHCR